MSSSEKSEFLSRPIPASLVTLWVEAAAPLGPEDDDDDEDPEEEESEDAAEAPPKKLDIMDQMTVKGVKRSINRDIKPPS